VRRLALGALSAIVVLVVLLAVEAVAARLGATERFVGPSRAPSAFGRAGPGLTYVVLGDSTAAGRGAPYQSGIAVATAQHLATSRRVTLTNLAVSGARMADLVRSQVGAAAALRPDAVLIAAGANDVTNLTSTSSVQRDLRTLVERLRGSNAEVRIVVTASPDVGSARRLAQPLRWVAGWRTEQINAAIAKVVAERGLTLAPIAQRTGPLFRKDPRLFAADRFHPNARGYATWTPVLDAALDRALGRPGG